MRRDCKSAEGGPTAAPDLNVCLSVPELGALGFGAIRFNQLRHLHHARYSIEGSAN